MNLLSKVMATSISIKTSSECNENKQQYKCVKNIILVILRMNGHALNVIQFPNSGLFLLGGQYKITFTQLFCFNHYLNNGLQRWKSTNKKSKFQPILQNIYVAVTALWPNTVAHVCTKRPCIIRGLNDRLYLVRQFKGRVVCFSGRGLDKSESTSNKWLFDRKSDR